MRKNKKEASSPYVYFTRSEETVYRTDETQKQEIAKRLKMRRFKKRSLNTLSFVSVLDFKEPSVSFWYDTYLFNTP